MSSYGAFQHGSGALPKANEEEPGHCDLNERFARLNLALIILPHTPISPNPAERTLHHPSARLDLETLHVGGQFHDLQIPVALYLAPSGSLLSPIGLICPDLGETWHKRSQPCSQATGTCRVGHVSRGDVGGDRQAECIDEQVALAPLDTLGTVKSADASIFLNSLDTLRIHDRGTRLWIPSHPLAFSGSKGRKDPIPGPLETPAPEREKHCLPGRKVA